MESEVQRDDNLDREIVRCAAEGAFDRALAAVGFGGSVDAPDVAGRTALFHAAEQANARAIGELVRAGANVNASDHRGYTSLMLAARATEPEALRALLASGADVDAESKHGTTALLAACVWGRDRSVNLILDRTRRTSACAGVCSPLHAAVLTCSTATVETLIDAGANVNARDGAGDTPLLRVVTLARERADVVRVLVECGAEPTARASDGRTPFEIATARGHRDSAALLATAIAATTPPSADRLPESDAANNREESAW